MSFAACLLLMVFLLLGLLGQGLMRARSIPKVCLFAGPLILLGRLWMPLRLWWFARAFCVQQRPRFQRPRRGPPVQRLLKATLCALPLLLLVMQALGQANTVPRYQDLRDLPVIDARKYGLKADGVTDDYTALVNAIAAVPSTGGVLQLPKGTIYTGTKISLTRGNIALLGAGVGQTIWKTDITVPGNNYFIKFAGTAGANNHIKNITVEGITFDASAWTDGTTRINTGTAQASSATTLTLAAGASATTDYYKNSTLCILSDASAPTAVGQQVTISAYNGTTKVATVPTWSVTPSSNAVYGILLINNPTAHTSNGDDQVTRGLGRIGFYYADNVRVLNCDSNGGFGWIDFRAVDNTLCNNLSCRSVHENAINFLSGSSYTSDETCEYAAVTNCNFNCGEGVDAAVDYFCFSNIVWLAIGNGDELVDLNASHYGVVMNCTGYGGNHTVNFHGVPQTSDPANASYYVTIANVVGKDFVTSGLSVYYGTVSAGAEQTAANGACHDITITNCQFSSSGASAKGMELSWTSTSYPVRIDNVTVSGCHVSTVGRAMEAPFNKNLTVRDCTLTSSGAEALNANHATYQSERIRFFNCRMTGVGSSTTTGAVAFGNCLYPLLQNCAVTGNTTGYGVKFANCKAPRCIQNEILDAAGHGIVVEWTAATNIDSDSDLRTEVRGNRVYQFGTAQTGRFGISCTTSSSASGTYSGLNISGNYVTYTTANSQSKAYNVTAATAGNLTITMRDNECGDVFTALNKWVLTGANASTSSIGPNRFSTSTGGATVVSLDGWYQENPGASQAATEAPYYHIPGSTTTLSTQRWIAPKAGSIVRVWVKASASVSAGTLTVTVYKNGSTTGFSTTLTSSNPTWNAAIQASGDDMFVGGDALSIYVTTDGSYSPTTVDIRAGFDVEY